MSIILPVAMLILASLTVGGATLHTDHVEHVHHFSVDCRLKIKMEN